MSAEFRTITAIAVILMVVLPPGAIQAQGEGSSRGVRGKPHGDGFRPSRPAVSLDSANGFHSRAESGHYRHLKHHHPGGKVVYASPWGESMRIRYWWHRLPNEEKMLSLEFDGAIVMRYWLDAANGIREIAAERDGEVTRMVVGRRAELLEAGLLRPEEVDVSAYAVLDETLRSLHSDSFLAGLEALQGHHEAVSGAQCALAWMTCAGCIISWVGSIPLLAGACIVGGVPTLGLSCIGAILAHEGIGLSCSAACALVYYSCTEFDLTCDDNSCCSGPGDSV